MKRIRPKQLPMRPDGCPMTDDDFRTLHDKITEFDNIEWIEGNTREIVERFMPDLADRLPDRTTETFDQAFGRIRAAAVRKVTKRRKPLEPRR
ncbi:hypothetical protein [Bradyrhizobium sp. STM 3557]|uniref:hypothetical protein n=1 Tax=Bradyrhizobium sp. STM 3557 TaxID=578920 RepID=UPI00388D8C1F